MKFVKEYGEEGFKTFLSLEQDRQNGSKILAIGEILPKEVAHNIFFRYEQIIQLTERVADYMRSKFKAADVSDQRIIAAINNVLRNGKELLANFGQKIIDAGKAGEAASRADLVVEIQDELQNFRAEVILFANTFKAAAESGINFEDIDGASIEQKDSSELTATDKEEMVRVFMANRRSNPKAYPKQWLAKREQEFTDLLNSPGKTFYLLKDENNIISFAHSEPGKEGRVYVGSVNTDPAGRRKKIGSAFFQSVLDRVGEVTPVEIVVNRQNTMFDHYVNDFGFAVVQEMQKGGLDYAELVRPPTKAKRKRVRPQTQETSFAVAA